MKANLVSGKIAWGGLGPSGNTVIPCCNRYFLKNSTKVSPQQFYAGINAVKPSLIRVEADELTYNLHIMLRFEIELDLIEGRIHVEDLPHIWNTKMKAYLGITPDRDAEGVLQDVHWSLGAFGYFPTYTLGTLYASMFYEQACQKIPDLENHLASGNFYPLKMWLNENVHQWGRHFSSEELVQQVTGQSPTPELFLCYLEKKFSELYSLSTPSKE